MNLSLGKYLFSCVFFALSINANADCEIIERHKTSDFRITFKSSDCFNRKLIEKEWVNSETSLLRVSDMYQISKEEIYQYCDDAFDSLSLRLCIKEITSEVHSKMISSGKFHEYVNQKKIEFTKIAKTKKFEIRDVRFSNPTKSDRLKK